MAVERELICIVCPKGCTLRVETAPEAAVSAADVSGHQCKRGLVYAVNECTNPVRTLTTTVRISGGRQQLAPVKSSMPLPKGLLFECMAMINVCTAKAPIKVGDIIIKNILGTGIDIISTANISREDSVWTDGISSHSTRVPQAHGL